MTSLRVCFIKIFISELLRLVFFGDENSFEIFCKHQYYYVDIELKADQYCFLVLIVTYRQKQQCCFHKFLLVEFPLMFEL